MHGNKRIRYQSKLIYSYEDGVPAEMNAPTECHQPATASSQQYLFISLFLLLTHTPTATCYLSSMRFVLIQIHLSPHCIDMKGYVL